MGNYNNLKNYKNFYFFFKVNILDLNKNLKIKCYI